MALTIDRRGFVNFWRVFDNNNKNSKKKQAVAVAYRLFIITSVLLMFFLLRQIWLDIQFSKRFRNFVSDIVNKS